MLGWIVIWAIFAMAAWKIRTEYKEEVRDIKKEWRALREAEYE